MTNTERVVPDEVLRGIGAVVVSFEQLEGEVGALIGSMLSDHQRVGQIITAELSSGGRRALLMSLFRERHGDADEDCTRLSELLKRAGLLEARRNQVVHSFWGAMGPGAVTRMKTTAKQKDGLAFKSEPMEATHLEAIEGDILALVSELRGFYLRLVECGKAVNNPIERTWGAGHPPPA